MPTGTWGESVKQALEAIGLSSFSLEERYDGPARPGGGPARGGGGRGGGRGARSGPMMGHHARGRGDHREPFGHLR